MSCDRFGCHAEAVGPCLACSRPFCARHEILPYGHACLASLATVARTAEQRLGVESNAVRVIEPDEEADALRRFRPLP